MIVVAALIELEHRLAGFEVLEAGNGVDGLDIALKFNYDLLLLDLILPGKDGLVHISQISEERVERVSDKLSEGDTVRVKVLEVDRQGRIRLSMRDVDAA